jgi:hypothetical protein
MSSEFDNLKDDAEHFAQQHPDQVHEGEQKVEQELGLGQSSAEQGGSGQNAPDDSAQAGGQDSGQQ